MGHLFLWIVAVILFLGDVGDSPRQWRRECGLEGLRRENGALLACYMNY